jgi:GR25 family glycosyltransferase involved in LPS biosynthesis
MKGVFINLRNRIDRRYHFENNVKKNSFFSEIQHMVAIESKDGSIGCGLSHIAALKKFESLDEPYVAIIEDDFMIFDNIHFSAFESSFEKIKNSPDWSIIVLTPRGKTYHGSLEMVSAGFNRIIENQTTTGYIVKKEMIPILIENLKESIVLQLKGEKKDICSIDQYWKKLQIKYPFYYFSQIYGGQLPGWSNIENRHVDYNQRFRIQNLY